MSQRKRKLTHDQLQKLADNFGEMSDEDNGEPFEGTVSDESFQYESESETSSDSETVENIQTFTSIYEQESPNLTPLPATGSQANQDPLWRPTIGNYKPIDPFSVPSGVKPEVAALMANCTPGEFFDTVVDDKVISLICNETAMRHNSRGRYTKLPFACLESHHKV
ncbi:hypothetical protein QE152_g3768 [Popillia japonica]|uniref:PiggyBac transposable element-derived protein domain-containing protein n=1 Tax=Popillia japonica TaxID=7064 RepID=A0AAW1N1G0_POPJA